jgi:hypothetical protein
MDHSKSRPPLTVEEFLSIIRGDPRPEATARFVAAIRGDGPVRPDEPLAEDHRPAQHVSHEDWLNAVLYGIHGPTHPDFAGGLREQHFNPEEPRDERGRWAADGSRDSQQQPSQPARPDASRGDRDHFAWTISRAAARKAHSSPYLIPTRAIESLTGKKFHRTT